MSAGTSLRRSSFTPPRRRSRGVYWPSLPAARSFFERVLKQAQQYLSDEHFTVDGTLIEAWASQKSFQKKDGGDAAGGSDFHGQKRTNDTHASKTDIDARLYRKGHGQEAKLSYLGHVLMENRNGLIVDAMVTHADGTAERDAAMLMVYKRWKKRQPIRSLGADKAYDTRDFVDVLRDLQVRPHVTQNVNRAGGSAIDRRTTRHASYSLSQRKRPLIERVFGWMKSVGGIRNVKLRGLPKVDWLFLMSAAAFNLWRIPKLKPAEA